MELNYLPDLKFEISHPGYHLNTMNHLVLRQGPVFGSRGLHVALRNAGQKRSLIYEVLLDASQTVGLHQILRGMLPTSGTELNYMEDARFEARTPAFKGEYRFRVSQGMVEGNRGVHVEVAHRTEKRVVAHTVRLSAAHVTRLADFFHQLIPAAA